MSCCFGSKDPEFNEQNDSPLSKSKGHPNSQSPGPGTYACMQVSMYIFYLRKYMKITIAFLAPFCFCKNSTFLLGSIYYIKRLKMLHTHA